jgi:fructose-specific phosphotransferase system component IIB
MRSEYWTRSSAFDPETLGAINCITSKAIQDSSVALVNATKDMDISDEERHEALHMLATNIAKGINDAIEAWKDERRNPAVRRKVK